jgi:HD-GYP domain-containing protein (c-di-GMP phosphodiesterase class II)
MNVATYSLLLAQGLGIHNSDELFRIGQGALLHDLGKRFVPRKILEKNGPLDQHEQLILRKHPVKGFRELSDREGLSWAQLMMVYQHHERCDGGGYPGEMARQDIHDYAQMCSIADVTDALTRDRPYRKGNSWPYVIEYLRGQEGRAFDKEMTECWISMLAQPEIAG